MARGKLTLFQVIVFTQGAVLSWFMVSCAPLQTGSQGGQYEARQVVVGHAYVVLLGTRSRRYEPQLGLIELINQRTRERVEIEVEPDRSLFITDLPAGVYTLDRVRIHEGPFLSMAQLGASFTVRPGHPTYLGTWQFGVDSPRYERMLVVTAVEDAVDRSSAEQAYAARYPDADRLPVGASLLTPLAVQVRLYEVAPYPRVQPYFRRHWW